MFSIIIPVLNQHDMTLDCINTIRECTEGDYELIIIDNGSNPAINIPFTGFNEARIIRNEENKGFPVAINQGIRDARGEDIIIMNNDVIVTPDALNRLIKWLDEYSIIGPLTNYCAGMQSIEVPVYEDIYELHKIAIGIASENEDYCQEVNFIIGFCFAFKKKLFYEIGEFDESLWPCSGEEIDFCFRAREIGYKIGIAHDVYVHHIGSQTFKDMNESGKVDYEKVCERSDKHLAEKWGNDFWQKQNISVVREQIVKKAEYI